MKTMQNNARFFIYSSFLAAALLAGCASNNSDTKASSKQSKAAKTDTDYKDKHYVANPSKVKFGEFNYVELKEATIAQKKQDNKANRKSAAVIDSMLLADLKNVFSNIKVIPQDGEFSKSPERTLQITPVITDIRLVSVGARIWWGPMAGGSDLVMHVDYRDSSTGEIIANPDFWKGNNAWSGGMSMGTSDNEVRDAIVGQIFNYTIGNK